MIISETFDGRPEDPLIFRYVQLNTDILSDGAARSFEAAGMLLGQSSLLLVRRHELWSPPRGPQGTDRPSGRGGTRVRVGCSARNLAGKWQSQQVLLWFSGS